MEWKYIPLLEIDCKDTKCTEHDSIPVYPAIRTPAGMILQSLDRVQVLGSFIGGVNCRLSQATEDPDRAHWKRLALTAARPLLGRFWSKVNAWAGVGSEISGAGLIEGQFLRDRSEEFLDVCGGFGRGFKEEETGLFGILLRIRGLDGALVGIVVDHIDLVAGERNDNVFAGLTLEFLHPRLGLI